MSEVQVRENGATLSISPGERVVVELPEIATAGYQWRVAQVPETLEVVENDFSPPDSGAPGAGGRRRIVFAARGTGRGATVLKLQRPWESQDAAADEFRFDVEVS
jgi:predicted secreted protein